MPVLAACIARQNTRLAENQPDPAVADEEAKMVEPDSGDTIGAPTPGVKRNRSARVVAIAVVALAVTYAALALLQFPRLTIDDAYITMRYATNLAQHGQLTWNVGGSPVEGYTGVIYPVLLALARLGGANLVTASRVFGIVGYVLAGLFVVLTLWAARVRTPVVVAAALLYCTVPQLFTHAVAGMETMLFAAAISGAVAATFWALDDPGSRRAEMVAWVAMLLAALVRPEGIALAGLAAAALLVQRWRDGGRVEAQAAALRGLVWLAAPFAVYFAARWAYYGAFLPNTFYVKNTSAFQPGSLQQIGVFLVSVVVLPAVAALFVALGFWLAARNPGGDGEVPGANVPRRTSVLFALAVITGFLLISGLLYWRSVLMTNFSMRFFMPSYPLILMALGLVTEWFDTKQARVGASPLTLLLFGFAGVLVAGQLYLQVLGLESEKGDATQYQFLIENEHVQAGRYVAQHVPADSWIVVVEDAGAIPYFAGVKTVDWGSLNDRFLTELMPDMSSGNPKAIAAAFRARQDYVFGKHPAAFVFTSSRSDSVLRDVATPLPIGSADPSSLTTDPRFASYTLVRAFSVPAQAPYDELVYLRNDLAASAASATAQ